MEKISAEFELDGHFDFTERKGCHFTTLPERFKEVNGGKEQSHNSEKRFKKTNKKPITSSIW